MWVVCNYSCVECARLLLTGVGPKEAEKRLSNTTAANSHIGVVSGSSAFQQVDAKCLPLLQQAAPDTDTPDGCTSASTTQITGRITSPEASQGIVVSETEAEGSQPKVTVFSLAEQQVEAVPDIAALSLTPVPLDTRAPVVSPFLRMQEEGLAPLSAFVTVRQNQEQPDSEVISHSPTATGGAQGLSEAGLKPFLSAAVHSKAHATSVSNGPLSPVTALEPTYWAIPQSDIVLTRRLGAGSFGQVWLAKYHFVDVAVKVSSVTHMRQQMDRQASAAVRNVVRAAC